MDSKVVLGAAGSRKSLLRNLFGLHQGSKVLVWTRGKFARSTMVSCALHCFHPWRRRGRLKICPRPSSDDDDENEKEAEDQKSVDSEPYSPKNLDFHALRIAVSKQTFHSTDFEEEQSGSTTPSAPIAGRQEETRDDHNIIDSYGSGTDYASRAEDLEVMQSLHTESLLDLEHKEETVATDHEKSTLQGQTKRTMRTILLCNSAEHDHGDRLSPAESSAEKSKTSGSGLRSTQRESIINKSSVNYAQLPRPERNPSYRWEHDLDEPYRTEECNKTSRSVERSDVLTVCNGQRKFYINRNTGLELDLEEESETLGWYIHVSRTGQTVQNHHQLRPIMDELKYWNMQVPGSIRIRYKHTSGVDVSLPWPDLGTGSKKEIEKFVETVNRIEGRKVFYSLFMEHPQSFVRNMSRCVPPPSPTFATKTDLLRRSRSRKTGSRGTYRGADGTNSNTKMGVERDLTYCR